MPGTLQSDVPPVLTDSAATTHFARRPRLVLWLALGTVAWKLVECGVSGYAAVTAHSPAILAFGSDGVVELISACVVLSQWTSGVRIAEVRAARLAGVLLLLLAFVVAGVAIASLVLHIEPDTSRSGMAITSASLIVMPFLAWGKRREARRIGNAALAADAIQSATCAYLALITLLGLALRAAFGIAWFDDLAALLAVPILLKEARTAWHGHFCHGC